MVTAIVRKQSLAAGTTDVPYEAKTWRDLIRHLDERITQRVEIFESLTAQSKPHIYVIGNLPFVFDVECFLFDLEITAAERLALMYEYR